MPNSIQMLSSEDSSIQQYKINMFEVLNKVSSLQKQLYIEHKMSVLSFTVLSCTYL